TEGRRVLPAVSSHLATLRYRLVWIGMRSPSAGLDRDGVVDAGATDGLGIHIGSDANFRIVRRDAGGRRAPGNEEIMSMDRLRRIVAGGTLAMMLGMVVAASGCKSMREEGPPGPEDSTTGAPAASPFHSTQRRS